MVSPLTPPFFPAFSLPWKLCLAIRFLLTVPATCLHNVQRLFHSTNAISGKRKKKQNEVERKKERRREKGREGNRVFQLWSYMVIIRYKLVFFFSAGKRECLTTLEDTWNGQVLRLHEINEIWLMTGGGNVNSFLHGHGEIKGLRYVLPITKADVRKI